jgi:hypothetical protein
MGERREQRVTIRLLPESVSDYEEFKDLVWNVLHSDVCYVMGQLFRAFNQAVKQLPHADEKVEMRFFRQNVQINVGCTFQYYTKKARRCPQDAFSVVTDRHNLLPDLVDQFPQLSSKAKQFWIEELTKQGFKIEAPHTSSISESAASSLPKSTESMEHCMTNVCHSSPSATEGKECVSTVGRVEKGKRSFWVRAVCWLNRDVSLRFRRAGAE